LAQSLLLALGALGVATVLGLGSALVWSACPPGIARLGRLLAGITMVQPPFLAANAWLDLTGDLRSSGNTPSGAAWGLGLTILIVTLSFGVALTTALAMSAACSTGNSTPAKTC
jgi:ABC-type Fe3+ transport system permease subunit